jgi:hypothetical protein
MLGNVAGGFVLLVVLCADATSALALSDEPVLPPCRHAGETRIPVPVWREDLSGVQPLMSGRVSDAGKIVYVSYSAPRQDVQVEESDVAYTVALRPGRHEPDAVVEKVTFWGPAQSAQDNVHFSGFYALQTAGAAMGGIMLHRLETLDIVSSRRFCIAGHLSVRPAIERVPPVGQTAFLPWCRLSHETRISIPTWEPQLTAEDRLPSEPPTGDGKIVYVSFDAPKKHCDRDPDRLLAFSLVKTESDRAGVDGIAVNFRGNANRSTAGAASMVFS